MPSLLRSLPLVAALATAAVLAVPVAAAACVIPPDAGAVAAQLTAQVNARRAMAGLPRLAVSPQLQRAAQAHACDSARHDRMSHLGSDGADLGTRLRRAGYSFRNANENVAMGYRTAERVVAGWMTSGVHRRNILAQGTRHIGIGVALTSGGRPHWVMVSGAPRG